MNLSDIAILAIKGSDYRCIISGISKSEAINLMQILTFGNIEIEKNKFYIHKTPIFLKDVDIEKLLVSKKISFGEKNYKYFTGYLYNDQKVEPLHVILPKTSIYVKCNDGKLNGCIFSPNMMTY